MGIVINSCVTGMHGMCLYSYLLCVHTLSTVVGITSPSTIDTLNFFNLIEADGTFVYIGGRVATE